MSYYQILINQKDEVILTAYGYCPIYTFSTSLDCLVSRYVRRFVDNTRLSNPNRVKGYMNSVETDNSRTCHLVAAFILALSIDQGEKVREFFNEKLVELEKSLTMQDSIKNIHLGYAISNFDVLYQTLDYFDKAKEETYTIITLEEKALMVDASMVLLHANIWNIYSIQRYIILDIYHPVLHAPFYTIQIFLSHYDNINFVNLYRYTYNPTFCIEERAYNWHCDLNPKYIPDYNMWSLSDIIEKHIEVQELKQYIVISHDKTIYCKYGIILEGTQHLYQDEKYCIPLTIYIHGQKYKLHGLVSQSSEDGGHTVPFICFGDYWLFLDESFSIKVYLDEERNEFMGQRFSIYDIISNMSAMASTLIYIRQD